VAIKIKKPASYNTVYETPIFKGVMMIKNAPKRFNISRLAEKIMV